MRVIEQTLKPQSTKGRKFKPKVIRWNGTDMILNHSFLATIRQICVYSIKKDVVKIGIIGEEGSGKTTMAEAIGHGIHEWMQKLFKVPFAVRIFLEDDLLNFKETLKTLTPTNYVLIFDDVSFLEGTSSKMQISAVKQAVTKIRHLEGGQDVKIILINNYHYTKGLDKYLRQSNFKYFTTIGSEEGENIQKMVGKKYYNTIKQFSNYYDQAMKTGTPNSKGGIDNAYWTIDIGNPQPFVYKWQDPFIPALFFDNKRLRHIVSPTREWMSKYCEICAVGKIQTKAQGNVEEFIKLGIEKHGEANFKQACRLKMFENGLATHHKRVMQTKKWLDIGVKAEKISLESIMAYFGWTVTKTRLRDDLDKITGNTRLKSKDDTKKSKPKIKQSIGKHW